VLAHNGHSVRSRGEGDSTFSVFRSPADALAAACAFQRALHAEEWPTDTPLRVRAALHIGPAELREGDYNSTAVNRCARLRSLAAPGQTLVSQAVADLTRDLLPEGVTLRSLGSHRLKDLQRPEQIFQLCHPDLPDDFAPLRSLDTLPTNLPPLLTSFIGREAELQQLTSLLRTDALAGPPAALLLTLADPGGAGKTRLAMQAGAELLEAYPDGVWLVELAPLADDALVAQTVAAKLGLQEEPGRTLLQTLQEYLRGRTLLLVLDNCEHLVDACAQLATSLLRTCPNLRLLATSREPLNIAGETIWRIPSLSLPEGTETVSLAAVQASEAARLFIDRAQTVSPGFQATEQNADAIARISRRLDGIALALELAAARTRALSVHRSNPSTGDVTWTTIWSCTTQAKTRCVARSRSAGSPFWTANTTTCGPHWTSAWRGRFPARGTRRPKRETQTLRLAAALGDYWYRRGYLSEGRSRLAAVLDRPTPPSLLSHRATVLNAAGVLAWSQSDYPEASVLLEESLTLKREIGDLFGVTAALINLGNVTKERGDYDRARTLLEESLSIARQVDHQRYLATALNSLGVWKTNWATMTRRAP
jgi:tetratricopeptide (TPR) repeat protein